MKVTGSAIKYAGFGAICLLSGISLTPNFALIFATGGNNVKTVWTLDADDSPTNETQVDSVDKTYLGYTTYRFTNVGNNPSGLCVLYEGGRIVKINDDGYSNGLESIVATFTNGTLKLVSMFDTSDDTYFTYTLTSGVTQEIMGNYFYLEAVSDVALTSFTVNYGCTVGSRQAAPVSDTNLRLNFNAFEDYATVQKIDDDVYFVLKGTYNQTPMASSIRIYHDGPSYYISASKMEVFPNTTCCTIYYKLSGNAFVTDSISTYYPHLSYNGSTGNALIYRIVDSKQTAPSPLTSKVDADAAYSIKFPNLAGGMVSIDIKYDDLMTPYSRYKIECDAEGKTANNKFILRETLSKWVTTSGYGMGVEYKDGYYYAVRTNKSSSFIVDKLQLGNGGWTVVATSPAVGVSDSTTNDLGRIFIYDNKVYSIDYRAAATKQFFAFNLSDMTQVDPEDITLSFGGIEETYIISAAFNDDTDTFAVLAANGFSGNGKLYLYNEADLTTPRATITVAISGGSGNLRDVAFYKNTVTVLQSSNGSGIVLQEFSAKGGSNDKCQQNYSVNTQITTFISNNFNAQGICFNDDGQYVFSYASWGNHSDTHTLGIFDVGDAPAEDTLLNKYIGVRYGTRNDVSAELLATNITGESDYVIQQSAATDGTYVYMLMDVNANRKGRVQKFDMSTHTFTGENSAEFNMAASNVWGAPTNSLSYFDGHLHLMTHDGALYKFDNKQDGTVDLSSSELVSNPFPGFTGTLFGVSQSKDGTYAASNNAGLIHIYTEEKVLVKTFQGVNGKQAFFGSADYLYVLSSDNSKSTTWPSATLNIYSYNGSLLLTKTISNLGNEDGSARTQANLANAPSFFEFNGESYLTVGTWTPTYFFDLYKVDCTLKS